MKKRHLFYTSAIAMPALALALATGVQAAAPVSENIVLTDVQKSAIEQATALRKQANDILEKAGLPMHRFERGSHKPDPAMREKHDKIKQAIKAGDYAAFAELNKGTPMEGKIDEATFKKMVEAHKNGKPFRMEMKRGQRFGR